MGFFSRLLDRIRGVNQQSRVNTMMRSYMFGVILSGSYTNWKTDPHPTFLCLGCYTSRNGNMHVHGIQLHAIGGMANWLMQLIKNMKQNGVITNPLNFFMYVRGNAPAIIQQGYRTYRVEACDFHVVHPGLTNIQGNFASDDQRDGFLSILATERRPKMIDLNTLKDNISRVINTVKVWS